MPLRIAVPADIPEIVRVTNLAYAAEAFCIRGDRTDAADVAARMAEGRFLVLEEDGGIVGSVYVSIAGARGYLGTLAVDPAAQGRGHSRHLIAAVEEACRKEGCTHLDLTVINLREDLFPFYTRFGFAPSGLLPFPRPDKVLAPLHLVRMTKALGPGGLLVHPYR